VTKHLLCLTVDTDPDGLSGKVTNRQTLRWKGLERLQRLPYHLGELSQPSPVPVTWFVRADGQLESILGRADYLLETHAKFWQEVTQAGHELAWHPHLYKHPRAKDVATMITDPLEAQDELDRLWDRLRDTFRARSFRNGEGWHSLETYAAVERLGFQCDSTAIPGRKGGSGHPMKWDGAPNQPYFPDRGNLCKSGPARALIEVPMNTWLLQAPYDSSPRTRYINPAVHSHLFASALRNWENACRESLADLCIWVMIFHPDEVLSDAGADALYSRSLGELCQNLSSFEETLRKLGHDFQWLTVADAADLWRAHQQRLIA